MIYCPKCGAANRDGSSFCNECGQTLTGQTRVKCARCGAMNPVQSVFCGECGAQLLSSAEGLRASTTPTIKGLSLPTKGSGGQAEPPASGQEPGQPAEEDIPAWLRELGATRMPAESATTAPADDQADVPDWLRDLRASLPAEEAPVPSSPDWLAQLRPLPGEQDFTGLSEGEPETEELPDWLAELQARSGVEQSGPPAVIGPAEEEDIPEWLAKLPPLAAAKSEAIPAEKAYSASAPPAELSSTAGPEAPEAEEEIPAWLAELSSAAGAEAAEPEQLETQADEEEIPAWLAELGAASTKAIEPKPSEVEAGEEDIPAWLTELQPAAETEAAGAEPSAAEAGEEGMPDWLAGLGAVAAVKAAGTEPPETEGGTEAIPAWLAELRPAAGAGPAEPPEVETEADEEGIPDWLTDLHPAASAEAPEVQQLPDWLAGLSPPAAAVVAGPEEDLGQPAQEEANAEEGPAAEPPPEGEEDHVPDWLLALGVAAAIREPDRDAEAEAEEGRTEEEAHSPWLVEVQPGTESAEPEEIALAEMPDWLQGLQPAGPEAQAGPEASQAAGGDLPAWLVPAATETTEAEEASLARAEIPVWLMALKPAELREQGEPGDLSSLSDEPAEETGLLAGLRGTLAVEMAIAQPRAVVTAEAPPAIQYDTPQARLFAEIVGRGPDTTPQALPQPRQAGLARLPLWLIYLALLAAVIVPLLFQNQLLERSIEPAASVLDLYDGIEALDPGRPVLVAFEYDPSTSDEMDVVAETVVGHLLDRGIPVAAVSLQPAGPPVAQSLLEELAVERPDARYVNLGYISGQAAAVQLLDQGLELTLLESFQDLAPAGQEIVSGTTGLDSFGLVLVLAAQSDSLRLWVEQAGGLQGAPLAAAVSASTEAQARSYYQTDPRQLLGLVAGVPGAAAYETLRDEDGTLPAELSASLDSHLAGHAVFVTVLIVGNLAYLVRRRPRGRG